MSQIEKQTATRNHEGIINEIESLAQKLQESSLQQAHMAIESGFSNPPQKPGQQPNQVVEADQGMHQLEENTYQAEVKQEEAGQENTTAADQAQSEADKVMSEAKNLYK